MIKKIILLTAICGVASINLQDVSAKEYKTLHRLTAGDVVSADIFNEAFDAIELSLAPLDTNDLVGKYQCKHLMHSATDMGMYTATCDSSDGITREFVGGDLIKHLTMDSDDLLGYRVDDLEIFDDGDGTFSYLTTSYNSFTMYPSGCPNSPGTKNPLTIKGNVGVLKVNNNGAYTNTFYLVQKASPTRITLTYTGSINQYIHQAICDNLNVPPEIPDEAISTPSSNSVTITWTDRSDDETGFVVVRRDSLAGQWSEIADIDAVTGTGTRVSYTDTELASGTYWYRAKSVNVHGKSYGSNVVKVDIE